MANQTIYPYGTGGQLPSSIGIIDDLTTGGHDKALSAEMGKQLNDDVFGYNLWTTTLEATRMTNSSAEKTFNRATGFTIQSGMTYHIKVTLNGTSSGVANFSGYTVVSGNDGEATILSIPAGETVGECDFTRSPTRADLLSFSIYCPSGSGNCTKFTVEITPKPDMLAENTLLEKVMPAYDIPMSFPSSSDYWRYSNVLKVGSGDLLYCYSKGNAAHVRFNATDDVSFSNGTTLLSGTSDTNFVMKWVRIENDGYIICRSRDRDSEEQGKFILYGSGSYETDDNVAYNVSEVVVAASDTTVAKKKAADYICDGTNDQEEINAAIAKAITEKRKVKLLQGNYYLGSPTESYIDESNNTVSNAACVKIVPGSSGVVIEGESPINRPIIYLSTSAYEALDNTKQISMFAVQGDLTNNNTVWSGFVDLKNILFKTPYNQKKVVALDLMAFGGHARLHSVGAVAYTNGYVYNGTALNITISNPPAVAVDGCIGIRFIGNGPNGSYGSELTDCGVTGFNEGVCINEEWAVCIHVATIFCVTGWVFGKYSVSGRTSTRVHPIVLICCGDERGVNLPRFEKCNDFWQIEMIAFTIERKASHTPGGTLGTLATEATSYKGKFRGNISYTVANEQGSANTVDIPFWAEGHGKGIRTINAAHAQAGDTATRASYAPTYLQKYYDTSLEKEVTCIDEVNRVWIDNAGNVVSNS